MRGCGCQSHDSHLPSEWFTQFAWPCRLLETGLQHPSVFQAVKECMQIKHFQTSKCIRLPQLFSMLELNYWKCQHKCLFLINIYHPKSLGCTYQFLQNFLDFPLSPKGIQRAAHLFLPRPFSASTTLLCGSRAHKATPSSSQLGLPWKL